MGKEHNMIDVAVNAARVAGRYLVESLGNVRQVQVKKGEERNLVSEIDQTAERTIIRMVHERYPDHAILAEESGGQETGADTTWVIDPLDGTTNFLHGVPIFSVSIGVEHRGELVLGVVYDPNRDELFTAERGKGAFLNGRKLQVTSTPDLLHSLLVTGFPYDITANPDFVVERFVALLMEAQGLRRLGSAALDLCYVAAGRFDGFWEVALQPWDMAAGTLLVREAGGLVTDFAGAPASIRGKQVLASNGIIHEAMLRVVQASVPR
jgi:myo-inositol-1(or 4)-monophosphatase